ncbi:MAG: LysE family transporter [Desulfocapsaceae bacterium]|nr:LysE family transporter [Desulfocapsaceae bacterium]
MLPFFQGFAIGGGLIIAIGAQNSFVLAQGVRKQYIILVPLLCSVIDVLLITAGAAGIGSFIGAHPEISTYAAVGGAIFLSGYGFRSLCSAFRTNVLQTSAATETTQASIIMTTLALSLLNPHVYFDTLVMLGSISSQFDGGLRVAFTLGACSASILWFFSLSLGGTLLAPLFQRPLSWRILNLSICMIMWAVAFSIWPDHLL